MAQHALLTNKMAMQAAFPAAITAILVGDHALSDRLLAGVTGAPDRAALILVQPRDVDGCHARHSGVPFTRLPSAS